MYCGCCPFLIRPLSSRGAECPVLVKPALVKEERLNTRLAQRERKASMKRVLLVFAATLLSTSLLTSPARARTISGIASHHQNTSRYRAAAHGVRRGAKLWVWRQGMSSRPKAKGGTGIPVWVNDAGPYVYNRKTGWRVLDLSRGAFKALFGGTKRGLGRVSYKVLRKGKGQWTGRLR
jgi:hypothetical protein